jgi:DNA-binding CsgD family transcriptional regulator
LTNLAASYIRQMTGDLKSETVSRERPMMFSYQRYHELAAAKDLIALRKVLIAVAEDFGFPIINLTTVAYAPDGKVREGALRIDPPGWNSYVMDPCASTRDPCIAIARNAPVPFAYDQELYVRVGAGDLWEEQAPFGFKTGATAVLRSADRRLCTIGLDREEALPKDNDKLMRLLADLQLLVAFAQENAFRLLLADPPDQQPIGLSARERDVLAWASQGKTAWETGMLLSISEHTVRKHLASAASRLGCTSKPQAVAKAIERGLL